MNRRPLRVSTHHHKSVLDRIRSHPWVLWGVAIVGSLLALQAILGLPKGLVDTYRNYFPLKVDAERIAALDTGLAGERFVDTLGQVYSRRQVKVHSTEAAESWQVWDWRDPDGRFRVQALVDSVGTVQAYGIKTFTDDFRPRIPILEADTGRALRLRESTLAQIVPTPDNTGTTLALHERSIAVYATSTGAKYVEEYYIGNPEHRYVALQLGGESKDDPSYSPWVEEIGGLAYSASSVDCGADDGEANCSDPLSAELKNHRSRWAPDSVWVVSEELAIEDAHSALHIHA